MRTIDRLSTPVQTRVFLAGLISAFACPSPAARFSGLPFSEPLEFVVFAAVLLPFINPSLRRYLRIRFRRQLPATRWTLVLIPAVVLLLKAVIFLGTPSWGFTACYVSLSNPLETGPCERSFEFPFASPEVTRIDRTIDFSGAQWNLSFVNSNRFNYYPWEPGRILRERLPFSVRWKASLDHREPVTVEATYVGGATVTVEGQPAVSLEESYAGPAARRFEIGRGRRLMSVAYTFDDQFRTGSDQQPGPRAEFALHRIARDGSRMPLQAAPTAAAVRLAVTVVDILLAGGLLFLCAVIGRALRRAWPWVAGWVLAALVVHWGSPLYGLSVSRETAWLAMVLALFPFVAAVPRTGRLVAGYCLVVLASAARVSRDYPGWHHVQIRSAGDDWLTYESLSRAVLESWSLQGGENVFYYQPLYRYFRFGQRLVFGDGDPAVVVVSLAAAIFGVLLLIAMTARAGRASTALAVVAGMLTVSLLWSQQVLRYVELGLSEVPAWMALPFMLGMLFVRRRVSHHVAGVALLAASAITRTNHLPALALILVAYFLRARQEGWRRRIPWLATIAAAILLLPLAHNLVYGGRFVPATTSGQIPENLVLRPSELVQAATGGANADVLRSQLTYVLGARENQSETLTWTLRGIQLVWLGSALVAIRQTRWSARLLHLVPVAYLAPHVAYVVNVYYPRHIVAGYLAMALVSALQFWFRHDAVAAGRIPGASVTRTGVASRARGRVQGHPRQTV